MKRIIDPLVAGIRDTAGEIVANGQVYFYEAGTTTLKTVYEDWDLTDPHPNPATLDAAGVLVAYCDGKVKIVVVDTDDATVRSIDHLGTDDADVAAAATSVQAGAGLVVDGDGALAVNPDGITITVDSDSVKIPNDGVGAAQIADDIALTGDCSVTGDFSVGDDLTVTGDAKIGGASGATFSYETTSPSTNRIRVDKPIQVNGATGAILGTSGTRTLTAADSTTGNAYALVASITPASHGLLIVRGRVGPTGTIVGGEGFSISKLGTGIYQITFNTAFADEPVIVATRWNSAGFIEAYGTGTVTTTANVQTYSTSGSTADTTFSFVAFGQRGA